MASVSRQTQSEAKLQGRDNVHTPHAVGQAIRGGGSSATGFKIIRWKLSRQIQTNSSSSKAATIKWNSNEKWMSEWGEAPQRLPRWGGEEGEAGGVTPTIIWKKEAAADEFRCNCGKINWRVDVGKCTKIQTAQALSLSLARSHSLSRSLSLALWRRHKSLWLTAAWKEVYSVVVRRRRVAGAGESGPGLAGLHYPQLNSFKFHFQLSKTYELSTGPGW